MIEAFFLAVWICLFAILCVAIRRALRQRVRECRHAQIRALRRFTHGESESRRRRRHQSEPAIQPVSS